MRNFSLIVLIIILWVSEALSQPKQLCQIEGCIADMHSRQVLTGASVVLLDKQGVSRLATAFTDENGRFVLNELKEGSYQLSVSYIGYQTVLQAATITTSNHLFNLDTIFIQKVGLTLATVEVIERKYPMVLKTDTLEFDAGYFKTREHAIMEELLRKLPGIQIENDGTIRVNGVTVNKVLIDGKPFFGNARIATRNLTADLIDKVQLIDLKSEQAQFTGISDGKTEKAINITIKDEKKKSFVGQAIAGLGTDERFAANGNLNRFKEVEQLSFVGSGNNVNGYQYGVGQHIGSSGNGITRSCSGGVNYNKDLAKQLKIGANYMVGDTRTDNQRNSVRQNLLPDTTNYYHQDGQSINNRTNHSLNVRVDYQPDTMHTVGINVNANYSSARQLQESYYTSLGEELQLVNKGVLHNTHTSRDLGISAGIFMGRRFKKQGRSLTTSFFLSSDNNREEGFNRSDNTYVLHTGGTHTDTINQRTDMRTPHRTIAMTVNYIEPVFKDHFLELGYGYTRDFTSSDKFTHDYNVSKDAYDRLNDSLSNSFETVFFRQIASVGIHRQQEKWDYGATLILQLYDLHSNNLELQEPVRLRTANFFPTGFLNYAFTESKRLRVNYSGEISRPDITQLQPVPDNSNPLYIRLGNPDLRPAFIHTVDLGYTALKPATMRSFSLNVNAAFIRNKIVQASWFDELGRQASQPLNVNGSYNISVNTANSFPIKKQQTFINANTLLFLTRDISYMNGVMGATKNFTVGQVMSFSYAYKQLFDFTTAAGAYYNMVRYTVQGYSNFHFFNYVFSFNGNARLPWGFAIGSNLDYRLNTRRLEGYNLNALLMNAYLSKSVFRQKQGLIKLEGFDLLKQNLNIQRNIGVNYMEDIQSNVLQRFFLISFSYFLK